MRVFAPAKVNLALHITGRRADGYHLLDSLVVFADIGDWLEVDTAETLSLKVSGPYGAGVPENADNLVWRAAAWLDPERGAEITLEKHLPHAGGIGGGSADAGAAIRALSDLWHCPIPEGAYRLGADIPVCIRCRPSRMAGIGEVLTEVPELPALWIVLVNPGVEVPTGPVFRALERVDHPPLPDPAWTDVVSLVAWLARTRNDLQAPAIGLAPVIQEVLDLLSKCEGVHLARMSGSGATCFGLFESEAEAHAAVEAMPQTWWARAGRVLRQAPDQGG